jgi:hypothetical protein
MTRGVPVQSEQRAHLYGNFVGHDGSLVNEKGVRLMNPLMAVRTSP